MLLQTTFLLIFIFWSCYALNSTRFVTFSANSSVHFNRIWYNISFDSSLTNKTSQIRCGAICQQISICQGFQLFKKHGIANSSIYSGNQVCQLFNYSVNLNNSIIRSQGVQIYIRDENEETETKTGTTTVSPPTTVPQSDDEVESDDESESD
ncbi:hypothetical protein CHUAL_002993 [Chamberlinius hualienensis]